MTDPDYVAQTCEKTHTATPEARRAWVAARAAEAREKGCTWPRHSWGDFLLVPPGGGDPVTTTCLLFEGWRDRPQTASLPGWMFTRPQEAPDA